MGNAFLVVRRSAGVPLLLLLLLGGEACARRRAAADPGQPATFNIPGPAGPKEKLSAEDAALVYPDVDGIDRDPFLYGAEEHPDDEGTPTRRRRMALRTEVARPLVLKQLHETVKGIIVGPRNTFFFQGRLFEEGDRIPETEWVVSSITPTGINLRSRDGATDRLAFVREAATDFQFSRSR